MHTGALETVEKVYECSICTFSCQMSGVPGTGVWTPDIRGENRARKPNHTAFLNFSEHPCAQLDGLTRKNGVKDSCGVKYGSFTPNQPVLSQFFALWTKNLSKKVLRTVATIASHAMYKILYAVYLLTTYSTVQGVQIFVISPEKPPKTSPYFV